MSLATPPWPYPWLESAWNQFTQFGDRLPHALLIEGPSGVGKTALSMAMVQSLLCDSASSNALFKSGNHPDLHLISTEAIATQMSGTFDQYATRYLAPDAKTASRKPRRIISVDQIRRLIEKFNLSQHTSAHKVALILPAEAMNVNASNALLKLLEEPPHDTVLILCSHNASRLPATIISRCIRLRVPTPDHQQALAWLSPQMSQAEDALALSAGAPLAALSFQGSRLSEFQQIIEGMQALLSNRLDAVVLAEQWQKLDLYPTLNQIQHILIALLAQRASFAKEDWWAQQLHGLNQAANTLSTESLCHVYDAICELKRHDVAQLNPQMLFEQITFTLAQADSPVI